MVCEGPSHKRQSSPNYKSWEVLYTGYYWILVYPFARQAVRSGLFIAWKLHVFDGMQASYSELFQTSIPSQLFWPATTLKMCRFDWESRGSFMVVAILHKPFCIGLMEYLPLIIDEFWITVTWTFAKTLICNTLISAVFCLTISVRDLLFYKLIFTPVRQSTASYLLHLQTYILVVKSVFSCTCKFISVPGKIF